MVSEVLKQASNDVFLMTCILCFSEGIRYFLSYSVYSDIYDKSDLLPQTINIKFNMLYTNPVLPHPKVFKKYRTYLNFIVKCLVTRIVYVVTLDNN